MAPSSDAVYYVENGTAKVRPLARLSDDQKRDLFDLVKKETMNDAKQCDLGLIMYSNDADDLLPPGGGFSNVEPYLKNSDLMSGFIYTPPGTAQPDHAHRSGHDAPGLYRRPRRASRCVCRRPCRLDSNALREFKGNGNHGATSIG